MKHANLEILPDEYDLLCQAVIRKLDLEQQNYQAVANALNLIFQGPGFGDLMSFNTFKTPHDQQHEGCYYEKDF